MLQQDGTQQYFMYEQLSEQRWAVYAVLHDESVTTLNYAHLELKADQWDLLSQLVLELKPLQVATTALCKDERIYLHLWSIQLLMDL